MLEDGVGPLVESAFEEDGAQDDGEGEGGGAAEQRAVRLPQQRHLAGPLRACAAGREGAERGDVARSLLGDVGAAPGRRRAA